MSLEASRINLSPSAEDIVSNTAVLKSAGEKLSLFKSRHNPTELFSISKHSNEKYEKGRYSSKETSLEKNYVSLKKRPYTESKLSRTYRNNGRSKKSSSRKSPSSSNKHVDGNKEAEEHYLTEHNNLCKKLRRQSRGVDSDFIRNFDTDNSKICDTADANISIHKSNDSTDIGLEPKLNLLKNNDVNLSDKFMSDMEGNDGDNEVNDDIQNYLFSDEEEDSCTQRVQIEKEEIDSLPPYYPAIHGCRSVNEFRLLNHIQEGTYGVVYRAIDIQMKEVVALKRLKMEREKEGFPITSLREINTLLKGQHPNVVTVREIVVGSIDKVYIVMDYVDYDLKSLIESMRDKKRTFSIAEVKYLLKQLLCAVAYLHDNWILHRDLKTSNLLLSSKGILKVGDFGLAREYGSPLKSYTPIVVTLWYRSPELLLCTKQYSTPIDMWSVGCIFCELLLMKPVFPGKSEIEQLNRIFKVLGTPNESIWPGFNKLPAVQTMKFTQYPPINLRSRFYVLSGTGHDLLWKLLTYDPAQRITADKAYEHQYFTETPLATDPNMFSIWGDEQESQLLQPNESASNDGNAGTSTIIKHNGKVVEPDGFTLKF